MRNALSDNKIDTRLDTLSNCCVKRWLAVGSAHWNSDEHILHIKVVHFIIVAGA